MPDPASREERAAIEAALASDSSDHRKGAVLDLAVLLSEEDTDSAAWARKTLATVLFGKSGALNCRVIESEETLGCPDSLSWAAVECTLSERGAEASSILKKALLSGSDVFDKAKLVDILNMVPACEKAARDAATVRCPNFCPQGPANVQQRPTGSGHSAALDKITCWATMVGTCEKPWRLEGKRAKAADKALWWEGFKETDAEIEISKRLPSCPGVGWLKVCAKVKGLPPKPWAEPGLFTGPLNISKEGLVTLIENAVAVRDEVRCPDKCETKLVLVDEEVFAGGLCRWYAVVCTVPGEEEPEIPPLPEDFYGFGPRTGKGGETLVKGQGPTAPVGGLRPLRDGWFPTWEVSKILGAGTTLAPDNDEHENVTSLSRVGPT